MEAKNKELTVEEINAYLEQFEMKYDEEFWTTIEFRGDIPDIVQEYFENSKIQTKQDIKTILIEAQNKIQKTEEWLEYDDLSETEQDLQSSIENALDDFDKNFDKCMAEFHAKQAQKDDMSHPEHKPVQSNKQVVAGQDKLQQIKQKHDRN